MEKRETTIDIIKTGDNTYLVNVQCESGVRWTERAIGLELNSFITSAYNYVHNNAPAVCTISGDIPNDVRDAMNKIAGSDNIVKEI